MTLPKLLEQLSEKQRVWWVDRLSADKGSYIIYRDTEDDAREYGNNWFKVTDLPADKLLSALRIACEALELIGKWKFTTDGRKFDGNHKEVIKQIIEIQTSALAEITRVLEGVEK